MIRRNTVGELLAYDDWANQTLLASAAKLNDEQLDRPFAMGPGSLRNTLNHIYAAARVWADRWLGHSPARYRPESAGVSIPQLQGEFQELAAERNRFQATVRDDDLARAITYTNRMGQTHTYSAGEMMLQVCTHGVHHRAQAVNMLRHVGSELPKPGVDYIFHKLGQPGGGTESLAPPELDVDTVRTCYAFADWARDRTQAAAAKLSDEQLDRRFEMGVGSLRETLMHIRFAEEWWYQNWTAGPGQLFPETPKNLPIAELERMFDETAARRTTYLDKLTNADLKRPVTATPRPGVTRVFPIGVTMLQLVCHGTHHRAQALNMFRHVGAEAPPVDFLLFLQQARR